MRKTTVTRNARREQKGMLNKAQKDYLQEELQKLAEMSDIQKKAGNNELAKLYDERYFQTYKIYDCLLEIEGKEIESI